MPLALGWVMWNEGCLSGMRDGYLNWVLGKLDHMGGNSSHVQGLAAQSSGHTSRREVGIEGAAG